MSNKVKIIHQTYKTTNYSLHPNWVTASASCTALHPNWTYMFWTDEKILEFLTESYAWFLPTFHSYPYMIQKVDASRYFILYHYGDVYLDLDIGCLKSFDETIYSDLKFNIEGCGFPHTKPFGVSNDMMICFQPKNPILKKLMESLSKWNRNWIIPYLTVLLSTGPLFLTFQIWFLEPSHQIFYLDEWYSSDSVIYFSGGQSVWHEWDASYIFWLQSIFIWIVLFCIFLFISCVFFRKRKLREPIPTISK